MKTQQSDDGNIQLIDVINHMQHHFQLIDKRFAAMQQQMDTRFDAIEKKLDKKLDTAEFRRFSKGVDDLDFRVQEIEDVIPVIKEKIKIS